MGRRSGRSLSSAFSVEIKSTRARHICERPYTNRLENGEGEGEGESTEEYRDDWGKRVSVLREKPTRREELMTSCRTHLPCFIGRQQHSRLLCRGSLFLDWPLCTARLKGRKRDLRQITHAEDAV